MPGLFGVGGTYYFTVEASTGGFTNDGFMFFSIH